MSPINDTDLFAVERSGTTYQLDAQNISVRLLDGDLMLVERGGAQYKILGSSVDSLSFQDTDLLLVERAGTLYKVEGLDLKDYLGPNSSLPIIGTITLTEVDDTDANRFTSSAFTAALTMIDQGDPIATKTIDAYVDGDLTLSGQFSADLYSFKPTNVDYLTGVTGSQTGSVGTSETSGVVDNIFDASHSTAWSYRGSTEAAPYTVATTLSLSGTTWATGEKSIAIAARGEDSPGSTYNLTTVPAVAITTLGTNSDGYVVKRIDIPNGTTLTEIKVTSLSDNTPYVAVAQAYEIPNLGTDLTEMVPMVDGVTTDSFIFPVGTDMSLLTVGDDITQGSSYNNNFSDWESLHSNQGNITNIANGWDGSTATFSKIAVAQTTLIDFVPPLGPGDYAIKVDAQNAGQINVLNPSAANIFFKSNPDGSRYTFTAPDGVSRIALGNDIGTGTDFYYLEKDGDILTQGVPLTGGTVGTIGTINGTTVTLSAGADGVWERDVNVTGPVKTDETVTARRYLEFDVSGNVTELLASPQSPAYTTTDASPTLTLTFPATFTSGGVPDTIIGAGASLTVSAFASNTAGSTQFVTDVVIPAATGGPGPDPGPEPFTITRTYDGNSGTQTFNTGVDYVNDGGLVITKSRSVSNTSLWADTVRGVGNVLWSAESDPEKSDSALTAFNDGSYDLDSNARGWNQSIYDYVSWTFPIRAGLMDIQTYMGNGTIGNTINHNLGATPGFIIFKNLDVAASWSVWHSSGTTGQGYNLNNNSGVATFASYVNSVPTDTQIELGAASGSNRNTSQFVAYIFAEDTADTIKCGDATGDGDVIDLGFEPDWILVKSKSTGSWWIFDRVRDNFRWGLRFDSTADEDDTSRQIIVSGTTFRTSNVQAGSYIYVAIKGDA